jgi:hypothetical protein
MAVHRGRGIPALLILTVFGLAPVAPAAASELTGAAPVGASEAAVETVAVPAGPADPALRTASTSSTTVEPFEMIGASWVGSNDLEVEVRVRADGTWKAWEHLDVDGDIGGDDLEPGPRSVTQPLWVTSADAYELRVPDGADDVQVHLVRSTTSTDGTAASGDFTTASTVPGAPATFPRSAWGARAPKAVHFTTAKMAFVHHDAGTNDYSADQVPAILRGIQAYHMDAQGWDDIAYNFLVDKWGRIWEGRGRLDQTVRGGHTGGFNTGSIGIAVLGNYTQVSPSASAIGATADIIGWTLGRAGADPLGTATMTAGGHPNSRYPVAGTVVTLPAVSGHLDVSYTSCPGALYGALPAIRQRAALRAAQANSPFGSVDSVRQVPGGVRVSGWAIDPNSDSPTSVHIYVGSTAYARTAGDSRPDVAAAFGFGDRHGFSVVLPAPAGLVTVCTYGINVGPGGNALVECRSINVVNDPVGSVDRIQRAPGGIRISGWSLDPNTASPIDVHAYVGGSGVAVRADRSRPDLLAWYPDHGTGHGFTATVPAAPGRQRTCTYGINQGAGGTTALHCAEVNVLVSPFGHLDSVQRTSGGVRVSGWGIDPDIAGPIAVHVYSNGVFVGSLAASATRTDVGALYGPYGSAHGFNGLVTSRPGPQTVCAYGINAQAGGNALLGCTVVG